MIFIFGVNSLKNLSDEEKPENELNEEQTVTNSNNLNSEILLNVGPKEKNVDDEFVKNLKIKITELETVNKHLLHSLREAKYDDDNGNSNIKKKIYRCVRRERKISFRK